MPLRAPEIDDRTYREILDEALARVPVHNPEWTNLSDADPGVTLLQLFAFMTESMLYRANSIPDRNRREFLRLLGVPLNEARPAQGIVELASARATEPIAVLPGVEVRAGQVPFRTLDGLEVLPVEARVFYKAGIPASRREEIESRYRQVFASFDTDGAELAFYTTTELEPPASAAAAQSVDLIDDTVDGSLWLALLARSPDEVESARAAIAGRRLTLGIMPAVADAQKVLGVQPQLGGPERPQLIYETPRLPEEGRLPEEPELRRAQYRRLETRSSSDLLAQPGVVELTLPDADGLRLWSDLEPLEVGADAFPPSLEDDVMASRVVTWVRIRLPGEEERGGGSKQIEARLSWIGINCARVQQRWRIRGERLGLGSGEPDQRFTLANTPVIKDSVELTVNGEAWEHIDALHAAAPEVPGLLGDDGETTAATGVTRSPKVFTVDRESGDIAFGDGYRGMRPPRGAVIIADYDTGGGPRGNVPIGAINSSTDLPQGMQVHNAVPTWGGTESESVDSAQRRIPGWLRHRDRLVSEEDYRQIVEDTPGVALGRSEILPLMHPELPDVTSEGVVTVMVVPRHDPIQPDAPRADRLFLQAVCAHLEPRRILTTELHVRGPEYVPIYVSVGITLVPHADTTAAIHEVQKRLRTFLSPLTGGFEESGWTLHRPVVPAELLAVAARVTTVSQVNDVLLGDAQGVERLSLPMEGLQLPRLMALSVTEGDAVPVQNLLPDTLADPATLDERLVPVPVIPEVC